MEKEKLFQEVYETNQINNALHFTEMAVHCLPSDQYGIIVTVGSTIDKNNSNPPHAHVWSADKKIHSRFQIVDEKCPETPEDLKVVDSSDEPLTKIASNIIEWAKETPTRSYTQGDKTNWDAMRSSWRDIQELVNEGLANRTFK
ncbi:hypothetical protein [Treponema sp.]|uniref:hypothetical protein n=1 Tax=Treponema sp. TaxID=166 RepID=UPI003F0A8F94